MTDISTLGYTAAKNVEVMGVVPILVWNFHLPFGNNRKLHS
jgi:hypothetical protein